MQFTFDNMFMPIASPVEAVNRINRCRPAMRTSNFVSLANLLVESNEALIILKFSELSIHSFASLLCTRQDDIISFFNFSISQQI